MSEIPIVEVTLMEDRARVLRRAKVEFEAGINRLRVEGVAPVLVDKTLAARSTEVEVRDASVERRRLHRREDRAEEVRELETRIEQSQDELHERQTRLSRVEESLSLLDDAAERTLEELAEDAAWGRADDQTWKTQLASLSELENRTRAERLEQRWEVEETSRSLRRLRQKLATIATPSHAIQATITVVVEADEAGAHEIEIEYLVPNACWRPYHRASFDEGALKVETEGCVWQNTGEDWADVSLRFSTQRPSLGAEPPELATDRLSIRKKRDRVVVETREQVVERTGLGQAAAAEPELPGIDDGGEVRELSAIGRTSVLSDGRPHRAALLSYETEAEETLFCAPELREAVLRKTTQANASEQPLLAGPVDLVSNGGFVGRTSILYVAPGERFELGWGPDPSLRVHRSREDAKEKSKMLSSWHSTERTITDKLSNLGPDAKRVELVERLPVSELEKVNIELDEKKTGRRADEDGFVRWTIDLPAFGRDQKELRYTLRRHEDVSGDF